MMYTGLCTLNGKCQRFYVGGADATEAELKVRTAHRLVHGNQTVSELVFEDIRPWGNIVWQGA